jgi:hypothetical protein
MQWRLNVLTIIAKGIIMALFVLALMAVAGGCEKVIAHLV